MTMPFLFLLVLLLAACSAATPVPTPLTGDAEVEEISVYAALFAARYPNRPLVLMDHTATGPGGVEETDSTLKYVLSQMKGVEAETAASFRARNEAAHPLDPQMDLGIPFTLLSREDMREMFNVNQNGWDLFYRRYPEAPGITKVSRVGFNKALTQALVYIGTQSHWLAGAGYFVLLEKVDGVWQIKQQVMTWIS